MITGSPGVVGIENVPLSVPPTSLVLCARLRVVRANSLHSSVESPLNVALLVERPEHEPDNVDADVEFPRDLIRAGRTPKLLAPVDEIHHRVARDVGAVVETLGHWLFRRTMEWIDLGVLVDAPHFFRPRHPAVREVAAGEKNAICLAFLCAERCTGGSGRGRSRSPPCRIGCLHFRKTTWVDPTIHPC